MNRFLFHGALTVCLLFGADSSLAQGPAAAPAAAALPGYAPGRLIVKLKPALPATDAAQVRSAFSAHVSARFKSIGAELWDVGSTPVTDAIEKLRRDPRVEFAEPDYIVRATQVFPDDPQFANQWYLHNTGQPAGKPDADIDAPEAWEANAGTPVLVAVIDSGIDRGHEDLKASIYTNPGEIPANGIDDDGNGYVDDVHGWDFVHGDNDPDDEAGHGTHVSGLIAAPGNNATGMAGVCWSARILPLKFLDGNGNGSISDAILAIQYAVRMGARVLNNSWGGLGYSSALRAALDDAAQHGVLIVVSTGNDAVDTGLFPIYPADYDVDNVVSVGVTDQNDALAWFSDYGARTVDLAAPGYDIISTYPGNRYVRLSGASMSCALVSGAACLLWSRAPFMTATDMKAALLASVDRLPSLEGRTVSGGRLNLERLVSSVDKTVPARVVDLAVVSSASNAVRLAWTASGDDGNSGTASAYELRYSTSPINSGNFPNATLASVTSHPRPDGSPESFEVGGLFFTTTYYFALRVVDEAGNRSLISNVVSGTTLGTPALDLTPDAFDAALPTGGTQAKLLTITNSGSGTLDFSAPVSPAWVRLDPASGRVAAGESQEVHVIFDAARMAGGRYDSSVILATNDPGRSTTPIAVGLQVSDAADIHLSATKLDLGTTFPGVCVHDTMVVSNQGTLPLNVSSIDVSELPFVVSSGAFMLGPGESRKIPVFFCPGIPSGKYTASLSIQSNDPDHPLDTVTLLGKALAPPAMSSSPPSLSANLYPGGSADQTISISNAGGINLDYVVSILPVGETVESTGGPDASAPAGHVMGVGRPLPADRLQQLRIASAPMQINMDASGRIDEAAHGAPRRARGALPSPASTDGNRFAEVFGNTDNPFFGDGLMRGNIFSCTRTTNLKEFRFYLHPTVSTEMWFVVYESETRTGLYTMVGASDVTPSGAGEGWYSSGDINVHMGKNNYYMMAATWVDNTGYFIERPIAPYPVAASFGALIAGAGYSFAPYAVFPPYGFQYIDPTAFGAPVAYYQTVITDGVVRWLSTSLDGGTVHHAGAQAVRVHFDATGLAPGDYSANVRITGNDPATPEVMIPVHLHVNDGANITLGRGPVDFGECFTGVSTADTVLVSNSGSNLLDVSRLSCDNSLFSVEPASLFLDPHQSATIVIGFKPKAAGPQSGTLTVTSSDPDEPSIRLALRGTGRLPPHIAVASASLSEILPPGGTMTRMVPIVNSGESGLSFEIVIDRPGPPAPPGGKTRPAQQAPSRGVPPPNGSPERPSYSGHRPGIRITAVALPARKASSTRGLSVLMLHTGVISEIVEFLSFFPDIARLDDFDAETGTPSLADLAPYDVVIVINDFVFADAVGTGNALADYVDAGGAVIVTLASFINGYDMRGRFQDEGYFPFTIGTGPVGTAYLGDYDHDHPIMEGVNFALGDQLGATTLTPGAKWVAGWDNGLPFVATHKGGHVVGMNLLLIDGGYWDGDIPLLLHNAIKWTTGVRWVRALPERGLVAARQNMNAALTFDARELPAGNYSAVLRVIHNDPLAKPIEIPLALRVDSTVVVTGAGKLPLPDRYVLEPNRPNPFNPVTTIAYDLAHAGESRLVVYDVSGAQVRELVNRGQPAGRYEVTWDGHDDAGRPVASGVYFYRLTSGTFTDTRKMVLLK